MTLKSWADVDRLTDDLKAIADWQDDLRSRIARALTRFELVGLSDVEWDTLIAEVEEFKRLCRAISFFAERQAA
jgi:hypothetical protein